MSNVDYRVVEGFGDEWKKFDHSDLAFSEIEKAYDQYFSIFPWNRLDAGAVGFDMGCGSGRWAYFVAPKVGRLNCVEPSEAIEAAQRNLADFENIKFFRETTETCSLKEASQDFGYCLGVLHHIPDTDSALKDCSRLLKSGAPFLLYIYYSFENKPLWFKLLWKISNLFRLLISRSPKKIKLFLCSTIAYTIYFPLSRLAKYMEYLGRNVDHFPLSDYRNKDFYFCKTDALDRFGTRLEKRFSKGAITSMLERSGFCDIKFSDGTPYWVCVAFKQ